MAVMAWRVASLISARTVTWLPGLFHKMDRSKAANSLALSRGGRRGRTSPASGSWSRSAVWAAAGVGLDQDGERSSSHEHLGHGQGVPVPDVFPVPHRD